MCAAAGVAGASWLGASLQAAAAPTPPVGTVSVIDPLPNYAIKTDEVVAGTLQQPISKGSSVFVDAANGMIIEVNDGAVRQNGTDCAGVPTTLMANNEWAAYDIDTFRLLKVGCNLPVTAATSTVGVTRELDPSDVVDSTSHVILAPAHENPNVPATALGEGEVGPVSSIMAVSEGSLSIVADTCVAAGELTPATLPSVVPCKPAFPAAADPQPDKYLRAISWYRPLDDVLAITDNFSRPHQGSTLVLSGEPGVAVTEYHVTASAQLTPLWTIHLDGRYCLGALTDSPAALQLGAPYRSENPDDPAVFVPCTQTSALLKGEEGFTGTAGESTSVIKVPLDKTTGLPSVDSTGVPTNLHVSVAPFAGQGWVFDPIGERGYLLPEGGFEGVTLAVYEGRTDTGAFIGRMNTGGISQYGIDPTTGRVYINNSGGLTLVDGRRTPFQPGIPFPAVSTAKGTQPGAGPSSVGVIPADAQFPYTRVILPDIDPTGHMRYFTVAADRLPVSQDPPTSAIDDATYDGAIPDGASVSTTYSANAAGYGVHSDLVGGLGGPFLNGRPLSDGFYPYSPQFQRSTLDMAAGAVQAGSLRDGVSQASSSPLYDINRNGQQIVHACSDVSSPLSCQPPPPPPSGVPQPAQPGSPPLITTQDWAYPAAECSQPGERAQDSVSGLQYTPPYTPAPTTSGTAYPAPTATQAPNSATATGATASTDCRDGKTAATGRFQCAALQLPSSGASPPAGPALSDCSDSSAVSVLGGQAVTLVTPPGPDGEVTSTVTAIAQGIHLPLPDGSVVDIRQITQTATARAGGRPNTANTTRQVWIEGVTVTRNSSSTTYCLQPCSGDQGLLDALNALAPTYLYVLLPTPDEPFGPDNTGAPKGSPGGYKAAVEASLAQQKGDQQFNQMNGWSGAESKFVPALRVVLFDPGEEELSREILDFAGVEADAELGVQVYTTDAMGGGGTTTVGTQDLIAAGVPPTATYIPGTTGSPGFLGPAPASFRGSGIAAVFERALAGVGWLIRSPWAGVQMAAFLTLLGLPVLLARRRWGWRGAPAGSGR